MLFYISYTSFISFIILYLLYLLRYQYIVIYVMQIFERKI